jgi:hypothetical protein
MSKRAAARLATNERTFERAFYTRVTASSAGRHSSLRSVLPRGQSFLGVFELRQHL